MIFFSAITEHIFIIIPLLLLSTPTSHQAHAKPISRGSETCGFYDNEKQDCKKDPGCVWMDDKLDDRPKAGSCWDLALVVDEESCGTEDFLIGSESECEKVDGCFWDGDECAPTSEWVDEEWVAEESCEKLTFAKAGCDKNSDCVWMYEPRNGTIGECYDKADIAAKGFCGIFSEGFGLDLVVKSKKDCNSIKGCSFQTGDVNACTVALDQLACDSGFSGNKKKCQEAGCIFKKNKDKKNKKKKNKKDIRCNGRWETELLSELKNEDGDQAKQAIEDEYGKDTYKVVIVEPGTKKNKVNPQRIQLFVDDNNVVTETPRFG